MKGLQEYCAPYSRWYLKAFRVMTVGSVISALFILFISGWRSTGENAWLMILPAVIFFIGAAIFFDSPCEKFKRKLRHYRRKGLEETLVSDFNDAVSQYDDTLRLGKQYIFVRGTGDIVEYSKMRKLYRKLDIYVEGPRNREYLKIYYDTLFEPHSLCDLRLDQKGDEEWKIFCDEISWRTSKVKIKPNVEVQYHYPDSGD